MMNSKQRGRSRPRGSAALLGAAVLALTTQAHGQVTKPERLQPTRIYSIGDSITTAFDSNYFGENLPESWANGFHGLAEMMFGFADVNSHNQRADAAFGVVSNVNGGVNGADMADMVGEVAAGLPSDPYYVTVELGGNDICADSLLEVTDPVDYIFQYIDGVFMLDPGLAGLPGGLAPGSTVYTAAVPDIKQLYDVGKNQTGVFGLDCETLWLFTLFGFPCGSMLSPFNTEQNRLLLQQVNLAYNLLLEFANAQLNAFSANVYWEFTGSVWNQQLEGQHISAIDCFHPSSAGQALLSEVTWADGPFSAF